MLINNRLVCVGGCRGRINDLYLEQEVVHHLLFSEEFAHVLVFDDQLEAELLERQFIPLHRKMTYDAPTHTPHTVNP